MLVEAVGGLLVGGSLACAASTFVRGHNRLASLLFAAALAAAAAEQFGAGQTLHVAACALAFMGALAMAEARLGRPLPLSWLDFLMGGCAVGALAVTTGAELPATISAIAVAATLGLARWRVSLALGLALVGIAALGELPAPGRRPARRRGLDLRAEPRPDRAFNPVVLAAILVYMSTALTLLVVGQFVSLPPAAATLATVTVLTGMARAGLTIVDRLRESERAAVTDDLTGLGNRRHLLARLGEAIEDADAEVALLLIDLDGFKELNDTLGHHAGDEVLRQIGPRLKVALREGDSLSRLGGDEFAVVLAPGDEASASATGLRLRAALERSFGVGGIRVHIDASIGIALFPEHSDDALGLLQRADVAMYEAKRTRTGHEVYLPARDHHSRRRLELLGELRDGLASDEFRDLAVGGSQRQLALLAAGLARRGHDVAVAALYAGGPLEALLEGQRRAPALGRQVEPLAHARAAGAAAPDLSHRAAGRSLCISANADRACEFAAASRPRQARIRLRAAGMQAHHYDVLSALSYRLEAWLSRRADLIVSNSRSGAPTPLLAACARTFVVVPNGIDTEAVRPDPRRPRHAPRMGLSRQRCHRLCGPARPHEGPCDLSRSG